MKECCATIAELVPLEVADSASAPLRTNLSVPVDTHEEIRGPGCLKVVQGTLPRLTILALDNSEPR